RSGTSLVSRPRAVPSAVIRTSGSSSTRASATAIAGSTWPAVPPPASTTDNEECPVGPVADNPVTESFTRGADLPVRGPWHDHAQRSHDAGRCTAVRLHDACPLRGPRRQTEPYADPPPAAPP